LKNLLKKRKMPRCCRDLAEQRFEYRIQDILERKGYLVINCARSKPFDLVAMKGGVTYLIEVKGKNTKYPMEQEARQHEMAKNVKIPLVVIEQSKQRGKFRPWIRFGDEKQVNMLFEDLEKYLE